MKKLMLLLVALLFAPSMAWAQWYLRCDPPVTKAAKKAADTTAAAIVNHLNNIDALAAGKPRTHFYNSEQSKTFVKDMVRLAYQHVVDGKCSWANAESKPGAPYVVVWDRLKAADKDRVRALGLAPE